MKDRASSLLLDLARRAVSGGVIVNEHTLDADETRRHVDVLARHFDFIGHDELLPRLCQPRARPFCLLTFDDGKRSNFTQTAPELHRLGVPATFYLVTDFLTQAEPLWFDQYAALARVLPEPPHGLEPDTVKALPHELRTERLGQALDRYGVALEEDDDVRPMSWEQARRLSDLGFTVGAHGRRHAILTREPLETALAEIRGSMEEVTRQIGTPCVTFSFPNGNYNARLARFARECGAKTVMTTEPRWVSSGADPWRLPRVQLHPGHSRVRMRLKLAAAAGGGLLVNPDGSGRAYMAVRRARRRRARETGPPGSRGSRRPARPQISV